jgi:hypothetical protein
MSTINLVGTNHNDPNIHSRTEKILEQDFDQVFVEGVGPDKAEDVNEVVQKYVRKLNNQTGLDIHVDENEDGRFESAKATETVTDPVYLDTPRSVFLDTKDNVEDTLTAISRGEITRDPTALLDPEAGEEEFNSVYRRMMPSPDLPYMAYTMEPGHYGQVLEEQTVKLFKSMDQVPKDFDYQDFRQRFRDKGPDRSKIRKLMEEDVYQRDNIQDREDTWLNNFEQEYNDDDVVVFTGLAHLTDDQDSFYTKLEEASYNVDRHTLLNYEEF